jgi:hypothetical protein
MQVFDYAENGSRLVWINDVLPDEFAEMIARNMDRGLLSIKRTLESSHNREA